MLSVFTFLWSWLKQVYTMVLGFFGVGVTDPVDPGIDEPGPILPDPGIIVVYYGCPNSKKAQKLQLEKKTYK